MSGPSTPERTAAAELLLLSPMALSGLALSSSRKRQITPTAEATSPKRIAVITRPGAVSPLLNCIHRSTFPNPLGWFRMAELAHIDQRLPLYERIFPNPLFQGTLAQGPQMLPLARHIILPFDLRDQPDNVFDHDKRELVMSIFPGTTGIACDSIFIILQLHTLPPKPWPLTIGGVPLYLTLQIGSGGPIPQGRFVGSRNGSIAKDQKGRGMKDWEPLFHIIKGHFQGLGVSITEVMYWGDFVIIILKHHDVDMEKLPSQAAKIRCLYLFDDQMGRPSAPQARCLTDPTPGNPDNSQYNTLQPGLRVTSSYLPSNPDTFLSTTSGVLLKDQVGNEFMTVASHGFPAECGTQVFHAQPGNGRKIGELIMEISHTDITLVKLQDTETFSNMTFQSNNSPNQIQLKKLVPVKGRQRYEEVSLDSPDTGLINGSLVVTSFQAVPSDNNSPVLQWVFTTWIYGGQDSAINLPEGMCGSAIWNEDGDVLGFFRYAPKEGVMKDWCAGIAADELIDRGFALVNTSDRT
ncbi:hypothetical protein B0T25DRAFT_470095 [Lasiosphaeria hispida]|uniref:Uncharacterized protein n=1 Tax=Lasiosphaeria hispida TaxID=260671 RepID=A0AAJ0MKJ0_9PEZI|nr:hypothetical protein B0T25DRAFT_470095 [Lasiosphaeria hispida]